MRYMKINARADDVQILNPDVKFGAPVAHETGRQAIVVIAESEDSMKFYCRVVYRYDGG